MKLFKPEDFEILTETQFGDVTTIEHAVKRANAKLEEFLNKSQRCAKVVGFNTPQEQPKWGYWIPIE